MRYEAVIVGGGVVGASVAYSLATHGMGRIAVVERNVPSSGSTGLAAGIVTHNLWNNLDIRMVNLSTRIFQQIQRTAPGSFEFRKTGVLTATNKPKEEQALTERVAFLENLGVKCRLMEVHEMEDIFTQLSLQDLTTGLFCPDDGFVNPTDYVSAIVKLCSDCGVDFLTNTLATKINVANSAVRSVATNRGALESSIIILAAGAWTRRLLKTAGLDAPLKPYRTQLAMVKLPEQVAVPAFHDDPADFYFRPETPDILAAGDGTERRESDPETYSREMDGSFKLELAENLSRRLRIGAQGKILSGWAGLCTSTPDRRPLLGEYKLKGLVLACGLQGLGVMRGPAVGEIITDLILDRKPALDSTPCLANRFDGFFDFPVRPGFTLTE